MRIGYIRITGEGMPWDQQRLLLEAADVDPDSIHVDDFTGNDAPQPGKTCNLDAAILDLKSGSDVTLVVATAPVLASTLEGGLDVLRRVAAADASLFVCQTGTTHHWHPDAASALQFALDMERTRVTEAEARAGKPDGTRTVRRWDSLSPEDRKRAVRMWSLQKHSAAEVAASVGVSERSLYRHLGDRGVPRHLGRRTKDTAGTKPQA